MTNATLWVRFELTTRERVLPVIYDAQASEYIDTEVSECGRLSHCDAEIWGFQRDEYSYAAASENEFNKVSVGSAAPTPLALFVGNVKNLTPTGLKLYGRFYTIGDARILPGTEWDGSPAPAPTSLSR